jgi:hypothetical protein
MSKELICLQCTLFECDEKDSRCLYKALTSRSAYYKLYYKLNKKKKLAANAEYRKRTNYWAEYSKKVDRREYFKERYQRLKEGK